MARLTEQRCRFVIFEIKFDMHLKVAVQTLAKHLSSSRHRVSTDDMKQGLDFLEEQRHSWGPTPTQGHAKGVQVHANRERRCLTVTVTVTGS